MEIPTTLQEKYMVLSSLTTKAVFASDELKLNMQKFFEPKDKKERALLFGAFSKYHHGKILDAYTICSKNYNLTNEAKYRSLLYLIGVIKKLK